MRQEISTPTTEYDRANGELGFRFVRALAVEKAALDQRLTPASVRVLAAISYFMNNTARRSWPGYALIAEVTGYSHHTIEAAIRELKAASYIFTERKSPITGGRALVHYGLCALDLGEIDAMVTEAVAALRKADAAKKPGVRMTQQKTRGSNSDPAVFAASDPTVFAPQKPYIEEPSKGALKNVFEAGGKDRGSRLAATDEFARQCQTWACENFVITQIQALTEWQNFEDYWTAKAGKDSRKVDWIATWRMWVRGSKKAYKPRTSALPAEGKPPPALFVTSLEGWETRGGDM